MSHKEAEEEEFETDSKPTVRLIGFIVESSKKKHLKKFDFVTKKGNHVYLTEEQIKEQKRIEESLKANMAKKEEELGKEELVDLLGIDVVTNVYKAKIKYDKYCDKMMNRRALGKITNSDFLTKGKGPITLKLYRDDGSNETIPNFKASDLHLSEWKEVIQVFPKRTRAGWTTIYSQIQTRMENMYKNEQELEIDFNKPLGEQDPIIKLNDLARKKMKHADDIHDYFKSTKKYKSSDFVSIKDFGDFTNEMLYTVQEIFFRLHQGLGQDDHASTFSSFLLAEVDERNLNPLKQIRAIKQLRQFDLCYLVFHYISWYQEPKFLFKMHPRRSEGEELEYMFFEGDGSSFDIWVNYGVVGDDYEGPPVFDDDQYEEKIMSGDVGKGFIENYPNFHEDENNVSFSGVVLVVEEESMPVYDTDIEDVIEEKEGFIRKGGFGGEEDNIKDVVVVANDLCSSMIQTTLSVDFSKIIDSNPHELTWMQKGNFVEQKARIVEFKRRHFEDYYSDNQYAVSIMEDTAYPCLHSPKTTKETSSIRRVAESVNIDGVTYNFDGVTRAFSPSCRFSRCDRMATLIIDIQVRMKELGQNNI
ncbi:hypothetical protein Tco_1355378 [Tanacetum coccineum]